MIEGACGDKKNIELTDFEVGALLKAIDTAEKECDCRFNEKFDDDDRYALGSAITKLQVLF